MNETSVAWIYLFGAGILEIIWAVGLKYTAGFTRPLPSAFVIIVMTASFWMLAQSTKVIPVGTAYAVWGGIGTAGTAVVGILLLNEPVNAIRVICLCAIFLGAAGLKLFSGQTH